MIWSLFFGVVIGNVCCESMGAAIFFFYFLVSFLVMRSKYTSKMLSKGSDFSLLLLAQGPVVDVVVRIDGEHSLGFVMFLTGFHVQ
jgi:hypothetical protein